MKFDTLDKQMRDYETLLDERWPQNGYVIVRIDGRGFTKLTKEKLNFERPFDIRFNQAIKSTCEHLMTTGIQMIMGYTQSDEISLLLHPDDKSFGRKTRKLISVLASEASSVFALSVQHPVAFDCRVCPLPNEQTVVDYFRWRAEDAKRNALTAYCYWTLREHGDAPHEADQKLNTISREDKLELLNSHGVVFSEAAEWERLGSTIYWETVNITGTNPLTGKQEKTDRRRLAWADPMPVENDLSDFVRRRLSSLT